MYADMSDKTPYAYEFTVKNKGPPLWYQGPDWLRVGADHFDDVNYMLGWGKSRLSVRLLNNVVANITLHMQLIPTGKSYRMRILP